MADKHQLKSLINEAELYRTQGLLEESREKYLEALQLVRKDQQLRNHKKLITALKNKILGLEKALAALARETPLPELSQDLKSLIKKLFSFSKNKDTAAIEGAIALAKFGQYESAIAEFKGLMEKGTLPLVAAKNIIRCQMAFTSPDAAIDQFRQWLSGELLSNEQLKNLRSFLGDLLRKKKIGTQLPEVIETRAPGPEGIQEEEALIDISSVSIRLESGPSEGSRADLDVNFQSGNVISVIISANNKNLIDSFDVGTRLEDIEFYSPIAIFRGTGTVSRKTRIASGPKQGDYLFDITISSA